MSVKITVYSTSLQGDKKEKFELTVDSPDKAYSFCQNAVTIGYWREKELNKAEFIPPHTIMKILLDGIGVDKGRPDNDITEVV